MCVFSRGDQSPGDLALSLAARELEDDTFIFALCHDNKLRMWSYRVSLLQRLGQDALGLQPHSESYL